MTPEAEHRRRIALQRLRERARRISLIRKSVVAGAVATFVLAWGLALGDQLAHGTRTSPSDGSGGSRRNDGSSNQGTTTTSDPQPQAYAYDNGVVVPVNPAPAPAPSPAPLTTSQS
jgi:hypothetical protein